MFSVLAHNTSLQWEFRKFSFEVNMVEFGLHGLFNHNRSEKGNLRSSAPAVWHDILIHWAGSQHFCREME